MNSTIARNSVRAPGTPPGTARGGNLDLPVGAGLSSSAALEVGAVAVLAELSGVRLSADAAALLAWRAEKEFVGVPTGTMDQTVVACGKAGHALLLDTRSGERRYVPFAPERDGGLALIVVDTGVRRSLADGRYAERRRECERAAAALGVASLRDVAVAQLDDHPGLDDVLRRRARHVVTENRRVTGVAAALEVGAMASIGTALLEGHVSLRDDFGVSTPQLDLLVDLAYEHGAVAARMTGGGFGGAIVALARSNEAGALADGVVAAYRVHAGRDGRGRAAVANTLNGHARRRRVPTRGCDPRVSDVGARPPSARAAA